MEVDRITFLIFELLLFVLNYYLLRKCYKHAQKISLFALDARPNYPLTRTLLFPKNKQISVFLQKQIVKDTTEIGKL